MTVDLEESGHAVVPFVTRVLVQRSVVLIQRDVRRPRLGPRGWIVDSKAIIDQVRASPREPLDQVQVLGRSLKLRLRVEVRRFNDEGLPLPVTTRIAVPLTDVRRQRRPPIQWNDPRVVNHLHEDHNVVG